MTATFATAADAYTPDQLGHVTRFAAGLVQTAREAIGLGDDAIDEALASYAYVAAPHFMTVAAMRSVVDAARKLALVQEREAGNPNVL